MDSEILNYKFKIKIINEAYHYDPIIYNEDATLEELKSLVETFVKIKDQNDCNECKPYIIFIFLVIELILKDKYLGFAGNEITKLRSINTTRELIEYYMNFIKELHMDMQNSQISNKVINKLYRLSLTIFDTRIFNRIRSLPKIISDDMKIEYPDSNFDTSLIELISLLDRMRIEI